MSRTIASALVLVNWKGVFYERYGLDRHVTALEGTNGAGKTTVMIAAYVVLLPDMSRLRFTNLGETGATGGDKGIWGRLGERPPSYAMIDFTLPGQRRFIAGVHLEKKGEPSVEPTPLIITGLASDIRLQDLLLVVQGDSEKVPELPELRESAARLGGHLQSFTAARDYFAALFDHGVTPLRLGTDEERTKLNEMLRTSMTGGISRALTSELRSFLLKEEGGLADTLQRMRANLDACRRTRSEVQESRRLEQEIGGVFEAGHTMFAAAYFGTRERADEYRRRVEEAESERAGRAEKRGTAKVVLEATLAEIATLERRRGEIGELLQAAGARHRKLRDALAACKLVGECLSRLEAGQKLAREAGQRRDAAERSRTRAREELRRMQAGHKRAAEGLADLQAGIAELHRRAGAYHQAQRRLREATEHLGGGLGPDAFAARLAAARAELMVIDRHRREATTRLADAAAHRSQHADVMDALRALVEGNVVIDRAHDTALSALQEHRARVALAGRIPTVERELADARKLAARQSSARGQAQSLDVAVGEEPAIERVERLLGEAERSLKDHEESERAAKTAAQQWDRDLKNLESRRRELSEREPVFRDLAARAMRLTARCGTPVESRWSLDVARAALDDELTVTRNAEATARDEQEALLRQARELVAAGGPFSLELLKLKDQVGAELVAGSFEDVDVDQAGRIEARLGGLANALVVDDPCTTAGRIHERSDSLPDVLLVARDAELDRLASAANIAEVGVRDVAVGEGLAMRVSRISAHPRIGRRAREARAAELRQRAEDKAREVDATRDRRRELERLVADGNALLADHGVWLGGDPAAALTEIRRAIDEAEAQLGAQREAITHHAEAARGKRPRVNDLRALLGVAMLLDPPDHGERAQALERELEDARKAKERVARSKNDAELVDLQLAVLRQPPLTEVSMAELGEHVQQLTVRREQLHVGIEALEYVQNNATALGWADAPARLGSEQALVPALKDQLDEAEAEQARAEAASTQAEASFDAATAAFHEADGKRTVAAETHADAVARFEELGVPEPTETAVVVAAEEVARLHKEQRGHDARHEELLTTKGRQEAHLAEAENALMAAEAQLTTERREAEPAVKRWEELRDRATRHRLLAGLLADGPLADIHGHVNFVQEAKSRERVLLERLRYAQGSAPLLAKLEILRAPAPGGFAEPYLDLWLEVRDWLRRRLPAQIAEVDDPREALLRLRDQLTGLEERLERQESDLRGASEDVARGIDVQIRKARNQVIRLNKHLEGISFGSIQSIRVRLTPVDKMEQVLRALREGAAQGLLFQADMPIEEALDEIFRRYGGGRTGGQRLLDYREYVHLQVEVRRRAGVDWEVANPTRLSTGEAIGVGAALMMVVLTEWERDATLLRGKKSQGSLRFLFLDEANRLSHDNLGVLFDLCQTLDLQLLIAAPEVAQAEGNTTYRLVRKTTADGREEVLVSGRRTRADA